MIARIRRLRHSFVAGVLLAHVYPAHVQPHFDLFERCCVGSGEARSTAKAGAGRDISRHDVAASGASHDEEIGIGVGHVVIERTDRMTRVNTEGYTR